MALSALALLATPAVVGATAHAGSGVTTVGVDLPSASTPISTAPMCADETVRWGGFQVLDAAVPSFDTGVDVVARSGSTLTVVGVSADGLDPADRAHVMPVYVGGTRVVAGATITGGDVIVSTDGTEVLRASGVTVVVRRCAEVAVAGPAPTLETLDGDVAERSSAVEVTAWPTAEESAAVVATLPETGRESLANTIIGGLLVAVGAALVTFGRRPRPDAG
jgi:LPXTG-motif cell wall-anchored protein